MALSRTPQPRSALLRQCFKFIVYLTRVIQARFALMSCPTFTRSDTVTDSERFYNSVLDFLEDPDEQEVVNDLMVWWNQ